MHPWIQDQLPSPLSVPFDQHPSVKAESSDFFTTISRIRRYQVDQTRDDAPVWGTSSTADRYFAEAVNDGG
jgi:hypothetical protein